MLNEFVTGVLYFVAKTASASSVTSPYPDVDELVQIAQKVSSTPTEITPSRTKSRFSFTVSV